VLTVGKLYKFNSQAPHQFHTTRSISSDNISSVSAARLYNGDVVLFLGIKHAKFSPGVDETGYDMEPFLIMLTSSGNVVYLWYGCDPFRDTNKWYKEVKKHVKKE
jgi:hypothetical protein